MLYCNIIGKIRRHIGKIRRHDQTMTHHHHQDDAPHPSATIGASLLRLSAAQRVAIAVIVVALLWAAFWWAIR
jgi:hypothetical protein